MDENQVAMCGAFCGTCDWKEKTGCQGCEHHKDLTPSVGVEAESEERQI